MNSSSPDGNVTKHLLVTNDFPPKLGGIQSYLHELWRRLPPEHTTVLTTAHAEAASFDAQQAFRIERINESFFVPSPSLVRRIDDLATEVGAGLVLLDPAWPLGSIGPALSHPFGVILHGAEVTFPARLPFVQLMLRRTLREARLVVAAGGYPAEQGRQAAGRQIPNVIVPPGVDGQRFIPLSPDDRRAARDRLGIDPDRQTVLCLSRLVPRKGIDIVIQAAALLSEDYPNLLVVVAGTGRDQKRLEQLSAACKAPVQFFGPVEHDDLPLIYGCSDVFAMPCRDRWFGAEQEGFGIVFLEAAAAGLPVIVGSSGGASEAVVDGVTGLVVSEPRNVEVVAEALATLLDDPARAADMGRAGRVRALGEFSYDRLAAVVAKAIADHTPTFELEDVDSVEHAPGDLHVDG